MKKIINVFSIMIISFVIGGCAIQPPVAIKPFDKSVSFEGSYDQSWSKLIAFLSTNDIGIANLEKDSGLIILSGDNLSSQVITQYCNAKAPFLWSIREGTATGSIIMTEDSGFVTATVNTKFTATYSAPGSPPTFRTDNCTSLGVFETAVLGSVQ